MWQSAVKSVWSIAQTKKHFQTILSVGQSTANSMCGEIVHPLCEIPDLIDSYWNYFFGSDDKCDATLFILYA